MSELNVFCTITANNGERVSLTIKNDITPTKLRQSVSDVTKIPLSQLRLIFRGRMIKDDDIANAVQDFKLEADCVLHCMGKPDTSSSSSSSASAAAVVPPPTGTTSAAGPTVSVPAASAAAPAAPAAPASQLQGSGGDPVKTALQNLRTSNAPAIYSTAVTTLGKILGNIVNNPMEEKYRKVKVQNAAFQKRLGGLPGAANVMLAVGFVRQMDGTDDVYQMHPSPEAWPKLVAAKETVDAATTEAKRAASAPTPPAAAPGNNMFGMPNMPGAGGAGMMPGMGGGMPPGGMTPQMQDAMTQMMSNPDALRNMFQNPMVQQMIQNNPNITPMMRQQMQQLANNPAMLQQASQMLSDPNMRAQMQAMMAAQGGGLGGGAGAGMPNWNAMPNMGNVAGTNNNNNNSSSSSNGNGSAPSGGNDQDQTEEDMIAEAIRRSLEES